MITDEIMLSRIEAAKLLNVSPWFIDRLVKQGKLPVFSMGGRMRRYRKSDIERLIKEHTKLRQKGASKA